MNPLALEIARAAIRYYDARQRSIETYQANVNREGGARAISKASGEKEKRFRELMDLCRKARSQQEGN